jgi:16S rRNA (cytosine1402-N4)-methyltransferase
MEYHKPVLLNNSVELLALKREGIYIDATFGGGGHSRLILEKLGPEGRLFGFDQDPDAKANQPKDPRFKLIDANFRYLSRMLRLEGIRKVDGILADFGISSHQVDEAQRGFSLRFDAQLDMRMNPERSLSALEVVNDYQEEELYRVLKEYGEITRVKAALDAIVACRPIKTTFQLKEALQTVAPKRKAAQFMAQVFQAIRIEVNEEIKVIEELLEQSPKLLNERGRLVCISYHSLEDRRVKNFFRTGNFEGKPEKDFYGKLLRPLEPITRKPIIPNDKEIESNPRARSAKLRAAEKISSEAI